MRSLLMMMAMVFVGWMHNAEAQPLTVDPESLVPLPDKFDSGMPAADGRADVIFAHGDSAWHGTYREWWRTEARIAQGELTIAGDAMKIPWLRTLQFVFDGPDRLFQTSTYQAGGVLSGTLVRTDPTRLAAGDRPIEWPRPGERVWIPHLTVRTPDGTRPIMLEATFYPPAGTDPAPLAIITHGSDAGRNQLRTISHATEAHWLRDNGFAVLALMRRGRGRSEGINGEEDFGREHDGSLIDVSAGVAQAVEDIDSAIAYGRTLPVVRPGPVLLAGQSRGGFLAMHYAGLKPGEVMGVVNFSGGWYPYGPVTTPYYMNAGRGAADKVPELWLYADNDRLYDEALIREYYQAFTTAGGSARFELFHGIPGNGHVLLLYPDRWRPIADQFLATLDIRRHQDAPGAATAH
jgi:dienelactone hydrolase